ncbi:hypothetical protein BJ165DRAFT_1611253 [Panaeolus papilionaceus]|nr:hypothetical protein BJ165DRAFT_1611253 [Panaeolus papilionaceus]
MSIMDLMGIDDWHTLGTLLPNLEYGFFALDATRPSPEPAANSQLSLHVASHLTHLDLTFSKFSSTHVLKPFINLRFLKLDILYIQFKHTPPLAFEPQPQDDALLQAEFTDTFPVLRTMQLNTHPGPRPGRFCASHGAVAEFLRGDQRLPLPSLQVFEMFLDNRISVDELTETVTNSLVGPLALSRGNTEADASVVLSVASNVDVGGVQEPAGRNSSSRLGLLFRDNLGFVE